MRKALTLTTLLAMMIAVGCGEMNVNLGGFMPGEKKAEPDRGGGETAAAPARKQKKEEFQGHYLTVCIDGEQTTKGRMAGSQQRWVVDSCGRNPTIQFEMDAGHLGQLKAVKLTINPLKGDSPDRNVIYEDDRVKQMKLGQEMKLVKFDYIGGGKFEQVDEIPPGKYLFNFTVNGEKTWDSQKVVVEVK